MTSDVGVNRSCSACACETVFFEGQSGTCHHCGHDVDVHARYCNLPGCTTVALPGSDPLRCEKHRPRLSKSETEKLLRDLSALPPENFRMFLETMLDDTMRSISEHERRERADIVPGATWNRSAVVGHIFVRNVACPIYSDVLIELVLRQQARIASLERKLASSAEVVAFRRPEDTD